MLTTAANVSSSSYQRLCIPRPTPLPGDRNRSSNVSVGTCGRARSLSRTQEKEKR